MKNSRENSAYFQTVILNPVVSFVLVGIQLLFAFLVSTDCVPDHFQEILVLEEDFLGRSKDYLYYMLM